MISNTLLTVAALALGTASAQKYGHNSVRVTKDSALVAANFPTPNITLVGPAFQANVTILPGFASGTQPPIDDATLGNFARSPFSFVNWALEFVTDERNRCLYAKAGKEKPGMDDLPNRKFHFGRRSKLPLCSSQQFGWQLHQFFAKKNQEV